MPPQRGGAALLLSFVNDAARALWEDRRVSVTMERQGHKIKTASGGFAHVGGTAAAL
ncbi:hypothetical protein SAMN04489834_0094 [Microterricola viridarii]|uniref:Uncharacterized protein n=1 Tax=Microterricola viridarii TaxID=412690 RepID=A0A1H1LFV1_9MICO|nr:hypothetical protein SAMN04489834_0094 [Microterricola viridarii]